MLNQEKTVERMKAESKLRASLIAITIAVMLILILIVSSEAGSQVSLENSPVSGLLTIIPQQNGYSVINRQGTIELSEEDASTAINYALEVVAEKGGQVFLSSGSYTITTTLKIHGNTVLEGEAIDDPNNRGYGTRLIAAQNLEGPILANAHPITGDYNIIIRNLAIDGSRPSKDRKIGSTGISLTKTVRCRIADVAVYNCMDSGIVMDGQGGTVEAILERISSRGNNYAGLQMKTQSDFHISNCEFGSNQGFGILLSSCSSSSIIGCNVFLNKRSGIQLYNTNQMRITSNRANHNGYSGIEIVATTEGYGDYNNIIGNQCYDNGQEAANEAGIKINPKATTIRYNILSSNICFDDQTTKTQYFGILENIGGENNLFSDNICRENRITDVKLATS